VGLLDRWLKRTLDNRDLEGLIRDLAGGDTPERRRSFYETVLTSKLMLATPGQEPEGKVRVADETTTIRFIATTGPDGKPAMVVFTSEAALLAWRPVGCIYTVLSAKDVFPLALQAGMGAIVINPSGPVGGILMRREIEFLAEGRVPDSPSGGMDT
jgi:hypothetical protein